MRQLKAIIIHDKPLLREKLGQMLSSHREIEAIDLAATLAAGKKRLAGTPYDLVLIGLRFKNGSGLDLMPFIAPSSRLIFITGHNRNRIQAFEADMADCFGTVTASRLAKTVTNLLAKSEPSAYPATARKDLFPGNRISLKVNSDYWFIDLDNIMVIYSVGGNYVALNLKDDERLICRKTLKEWEKLLPMSTFIRIHRSTIINFNFIKRISYQKDGSCRLFVAGSDREFTVSRRFASQFKEMMETRFPAPPKESQAYRSSQNSNRLSQFD